MGGWLCWQVSTWWPIECWHILSVCETSRSGVDTCMLWVCEITQSVWKSKHWWLGGCWRECGDKRAHNRATPRFFHQFCSIVCCACLCSAYLQVFIAHWCVRRAECTRLCCRVAGVHCTQYMYKYMHCNVNTQLRALDCWLFSHPLSQLLPNQIVPTCTTSSSAELLSTREHNWLRSKPQTVVRGKTALQHNWPRTKLGSSASAPKLL